MKTILSIITVSIIILIGFFENISLAEPDSASKIPTELIARKLKKNDPSLAIAV